MINDNKPIDAEFLNEGNPSAVTIQAPGSTNYSTTNFVDDTQITTTNVRNTISNYDMGPAKHDQNSIADFLAKPYLLQNGFVSTASTSNAVLYASNIGGLFSSIGIYREKVKGYNLIRATAVVRVVLNAQPFQQGRLLLHFIPCASELGSFNVINHNSDLCTKTQQPGVELDFQSGAVEMEIPYITPSPYYDLQKAIYDWGTFYLSVLSPMKVGSAGSTSVEYSVFISFKDVELAAPVYYAQSGNLDTGAKRTRVKMNKVLDDEEKNTGWLSSGLAKASEIAGALAEIPYLEPVAAPGKIVFSGLSAIAKFFGWSKPININSISYMQQHVGRNNQNYDATNNADVMALSKDSKVPPYNGVFGLDEDEMAFSYIKSVPALVDSFNVTSTMVNDTQVYTQIINPQMLSYPSYTVGSVIYNPRPPFAHISTLFGLWRGGVKITLKPVKTSFHSLRLMVIFTPSGTNFVSNANSAYSLREIIDIKKSDEFTFTLPYLLNTQYVNTLQGGLLDPVTSYASGTLEVRVLNELRAPETCSQNIDFLVYYSAAEDFELAGYNPTVLGNFEVQSGQIGNAHEDDTTLHNNLACIGDPFLSLKQLTNISTQMNNMQPLVENGTGATTLVLRPFALSNWRYEAGASRNPASDIISFLSTGYVFSRGGIRITIPSPQYANYAYRSGLIPAKTFNLFYQPRSDQFVTRTGYLPISNASVNNNLGSFERVLSPLSTVRNENQGLICDAVIPHCSRTPVRINKHTAGLDDMDQSSNLWAPLYNFWINVCGGGLRSVPPYDALAIYRAGADDFSLGYFYGFTPFGTPPSEEPPST